MPTAGVDIKVVDRPQPGVAVARDLAQALELKASPVEVAFGTRKVRLRLEVEVGLPPGTVALASRAAAGICIPPGVSRILACRRQEGSLRLGPLVGYIVPPALMEPLRAGVFNPMYWQLSRYAAEGEGLLCFFSAGDITHPGGVVRACYLRAATWQEAVLPLPRVIYERARTLQRRWPELDPGLRQALVDSGEVLFLNPPLTTTKLQDLAALAGEEALRPLLPATRPLTYDALVEFTRAHAAVYLKPVDRNRGRGVLRVQRHGEGWLAQSQTRAGVKSVQQRSLRGVLKSIPSGSPYLVQEGLDLASFFRNRYDLRVTVQKDVHGNWRVTGMVARLAPRGGVITSPRSGGAVYPPLRALEHSLGAVRARTVFGELVDAAVTIARTMERHFGHCSQFGLDMAVTRGGEVKLIEVNHRPLMVSQGRLGDPAVMERVYRYPIAYAFARDFAAGEEDRP